MHKTTAKFPSLAKVFESVVENSLSYKHLVCCDDDHLQRGFKKDCRTSDNLFVLYNLVETQKSRKKTLYVCYIDLTEAFDYLNRDALIVKPQQRNVDEKFLNTIKSMFHKSSSRVEWNGKISKPINNRYGVMQGGVLSPKLFNEFLQDLRKYLNPKYGLKMGDLYLAYLLFADDIVFFSEFAENLQAQIELFYKYSTDFTKWDRFFINGWPALTLASPSLARAQARRDRRRIGCAQRMKWARAPTRFGPEKYTRPNPTWACTQYTVWRLTWML